MRTEEQFKQCLEHGKWSIFFFPLFYLVFVALIIEIINQSQKSRNLVFHSVAFTRQDMGVKAKQWRLDIARESMALLRLLVTGK